MSERSKFIQDLRINNMIWYTDSGNKISGRYLLAQIMDYHSERTEDTPITLIKITGGTGTYLEKDTKIADISQ